MPQHARPYGVQQFAAATGFAPVKRMPCPTQGSAAACLLCSCERSVSPLSRLKASYTVAKRSRWSVRLRVAQAFKLARSVTRPPTRSSEKSTAELYWLDGVLTFCLHRLRVYISNSEALNVLFKSLPPLITAEIQRFAYYCVSRAPFKYQFSRARD